VAVLVKPFLLSSWSDVVLCPLTYGRLRRCDLCSGRSHACGLSASNALLSGSASVYRSPAPACASGTGERRGGQPLLPSGPRCAPCLLSRGPPQLRLAALPARGERRPAAVRAAPSGPPPGSINRHQAMSR
jgi:hypothetical protein